MTNQNYTSNEKVLSVDEIKKIVLSNKKRYKEILERDYPDTFNEINTKFPQLEGFKFCTKVYWYINNLQDFPTYICPVCGHEEYLNRDVYSVFNGYDEWMNRAGHTLSCVHKNKKVQLKTQTTNIERRGCPFTWQSKDVQQKSRKTNIERRGVPYSSQSSEVKAKCSKTWKQKSKQEMDERTRKTIKTWQQKYHVDNVFQLESVKQKIRSKNLSNLGVEYPAQSPSVREKQKQTMLNNTGYDNALRVPEIKEQVHKTQQERYGGWFVQSKQFQNIRRHKFTSPKFPGISFDSTWEMKVYDYCISNNIEFEYRPDIQFEYEYDGALHIYHPDFIIKGRVYEVKGEQFFKYDENTGREVMICPYGKRILSKDQYRWLCGLYEAKHQCMISNGIIILRKKEINNLSNIFV